MCFSKGRILWRFVTKICLIKRSTEVIRTRWQNYLQDSRGAFRTFVRFALVWVCRFPLRLGVWEGLRLVIVALPGLFSYPFSNIKKYCVLTLGWIKTFCICFNIVLKQNVYVFFVDLMVSWETSEADRRNAYSWNCITIFTLSNGKPLFLTILLLKFEIGKSSFLYLSKCLSIAGWKENN